MSSGVGAAASSAPAAGLRAFDRKVTVAELILRCSIVGLGVAAAVLVGSDSQVRTIFSIRKKAQFTDMKSLVFLVAANGVAAGYSLLQMVRCAVSMARGRPLFSKPLAWAIFSGDQVMAYVTVAAVAAALQGAVVAEMGEEELQWMKTCDLYRRFCRQAGEGIAAAVLVTLAMIGLSCISAFSLFRLYEGDGGRRRSRKSSPGW